MSSLFNNVFLFQKKSLTSPSSYYSVSQKYCYFVPVFLTFQNYLLFPPSFYLRIYLSTNLLTFQKCPRSPESPRVQNLSAVLRKTKRTTKRMQPIEMHIHKDTVVRLAHPLHALKLTLVRAH